MSVPTWLSHATPDSNDEKVPQNPIGAPSMAFSRPPAPASFDPSQLQYQQMQLRMQNDTMRHGQPSSQNPIYNTQNIVPSKRSRPRDGSIGTLLPEYPGGPPAQRLQTSQGTYQGFPQAVQGGPLFRGSAAYQHVQQNLTFNPNQSPMIHHQGFNPQVLDPTVHRPSSLPFSPVAQGLAQNTAPQSDRIGRTNTAQRGGQTYPPYGTNQVRAHPINNATNTIANRMPVSQFPNTQKLNSQEKKIYLESGTRQMQQAMSHMQSKSLNMPQRPQNPSCNPVNYPVNTVKNYETVQVQRQAQARINSIQAQSRPNHLDRLLRSMIQYMHSRRLPFNPRPVIAAKPVSCVPIFLLGMKLGGSKKIQRLAEWSKLARLLSVPKSKITVAGREIQVYWDSNLVQWERHFVQLQHSDLPHQRHQRQIEDRSHSRSQHRHQRRITKEHMKGMNHLQNVDSSMAQASSSFKKRDQRPQGQRSMQPSARPQTSTSLDPLTQQFSHQELPNGLKTQQNLYIREEQSHVQGSRVIADQHRSRNFQNLRSITRSGTISMDYISEKNVLLKNNSKFNPLEVKSKDTFLGMLAEGTFRGQEAKVHFPKMKLKDTTLQELKSKDVFLKMIAEGAFRRKMTRKTPHKKNAVKTSQKRSVEDAFPKTAANVKDVVLRRAAKGIFPKVLRKARLPMTVAKATVSKVLAKDTFSKVSAKNNFSKMKGKNTLQNVEANATNSKLMLPPPRPLMSYYTPRVHALDPSTYKFGGPENVRKSLPFTKAAPVAKNGDEVSEKQSRTEYHGGLPISDVWFKDTLDVLVMYKRSTPQLNELGVIDIQALILSMKSGIHGEVRLALDVIAALSHTNPPALRECEELLDTLIDFATDQIKILLEGSSKSPHASWFPSHQELVRGFKTQSYMLQEIPKIGSRSYDLDRAANRLVGVTTILRNLSLRPDNRESLREPSVIRMITTVVRYLGTCHLFLRTYQNALDFGKDIVIFLSALSPYISLTSKEEGLALMQFLLSFAPEPRPKIEDDKISFASYVPTVHRYLPHAVNALAKLIARDPNRALYRSIFTSEGASSPPYDLLNRAFGLAVSVIPEVAHHQGRGKGIIDVRSPIIAQGLLSAGILVGMLPTSAHDVAYSWLGSQDGFVFRLMALLSLISTTPKIEMRRRPDGRLRTANNLHLGYRMISARGRRLLSNLTEKAQDAPTFATSFSPDVFRLKQSVIRALVSHKEQ